MSTTTRSHDDYTVAWICALSPEKTAAVLMLDTQHPPLPKAPSDENNYTLGETQGHNIVIVCLPLGIYGTNSAAVCVAQMKTTFPSMRYALVVGIGGGAPSVDHDIRLGDVVVSKPTADHGGVIQYDYGVAAAFGKELLAVVEPHRGRNGRKRKYDQYSEDISFVIQNDLLPYAPQAAFDGQNVHDLCLENTRVQILREITEWAIAPSGSHRQPIFWLNGNGGTGKSTVAKTIAASLAQKKKLGGSFFFNIADSQCSGLDLFFTTLANHLIQYQPTVGRRILDAVKHHHMIKTASFESQWERLILGPIAEAGREGSPIVLVIDALDECIGDRKRHANVLLTVLAELARDDKVQLRVFVTSRPEAFRFHQIANERLHEVNLHYAADGEHDVSYFLRWQLNQIRDLFCPEDKSWPDAEDVLAIQRQGGNLFVYVAAVCRLLRESELDYDRKLKAIARSTNSGVDALFDIYRRILFNAILPGYSASASDPFCSAVTRIIGTVVVLQKPLSSPGLINC